ncbi:hypothetical protein [Nocardioides sp.]|uniref:hypothetical protein n=1 Tax=Nocardioides sp. TaxID=35761 RepID=UPI00271BCC4F|nr:hypothetical protein [Nocardioides sp.]MDO9456355.1 hypothetical protein [Nocardioides sp.]
MAGPYDVSNDPFGFGAGLPPVVGAAMQGAQNLLIKAATAWDAGDDARASTLLDRAAAMPFVQAEDIWPGPYGAHMLLFELLTHTVETGEAHDWFAAVEATFATIPEGQVAPLCDALAPLIADWDLGADLERLVRTLVAGRLTDDHRWMHDDLDPALLRSGTEAILKVAVRLSDELESRGLCSHLVPEYW